MLTLCPLFPFLPLLLLTLLWHVQTYPNKNSSPDFRMATRDFRAEESPYFFPRKLRKAKTVQLKFSRKDTPLVFQAGTQNPCGHKASFIHSNGVLLHHYLSVYHVTHIYSLN